MTLFRYALLALLFSVSAAAQPVAEAVVRVRILSQPAPTAVRVEATNRPLHVVVDGRDLTSIAPGNGVTLSRSGGRVAVRGAVDATGHSVRIDGDAFEARAGAVVRQYPGSLHVRSAGGQLELVNHAPTELYVASVVQSEFGFAELEGAKAQAVLARTYARRRAGAHPTYDLDDDQRAQVYKGSRDVSAVSLRAATETQGEVLEYRGGLADAYYFSSSGGYTADNDAVWAGTPVPYLRGVPDPYDAASPDHAWQTTASRAAVLSALSRSFGGRVQGFEITRRTRSGRIQSIRLIGADRESITGPEFRRAVNAVAGARTVRSTRFDARVEGDAYVFTGSGYGHGVGMSQYGALGQARAGRSYRDILAYYFVGTDVVGPGGLGAAPVLVASSDRSGVGAASAPVPREPASALRTRYRPTTARRWPTPRREARQQEAETRQAPAWSTSPASGAPPHRPVIVTPPPAPQRQARAPARRTAW